MRPKNADSAETWDRIVVAARRQLTDDEAGGLDVSVRNVATEADVSLGTIHYYFPTKDALLEACLDAYYDDLGKLAASLMLALHGTTRDTARATIDESIRSIYRFAVSERQRLKLRASTNAARGMLHPDRHAHVRGPYLDSFTPIIAQLTGAAPQHVRMTFQTLTFAVMQYVLLCDAEIAQITGASGSEGRRRVEDHLVDISLRILLTPDPKAA